jgi:hypothetical protein
MDEAFCGGPCARDDAEESAIIVSVFDVTLSPICENRLS